MEQMCAHTHSRETIHACDTSGWIMVSLCFVAAVPLILHRLGQWRVAARVLSAAQPRLLHSSRTAAAAIVEK